MNRAKQVALQSLAIARAEWLRLLTSPVWAILLVLWTLVCGLFFQVVLDHAAHDALPAGETPVSSFFRYFPGLLPLLLVVFVPQLTMDAIAGRRERQRLEHLLLGGMHPGALIIGTYAAVCTLLLLLLIPPILFHLVLGGAVDADRGHSLGGLIALYLEAVAIAALGLCCSAWAPGRVSAGLFATAVGIAWWVSDMFAPALASGEQVTDHAALHTALGLSQPLHSFAGGLVEWRSVLAFMTAAFGLLLAARIGLVWRSQPLPRLLTAAGLLLACWAALLHSANIAGTSDLTSHASYEVSEQTEQVVADLHAAGGIQVTLIATNAMRNDPVDGPLVEHARSLLQRLGSQGMAWVHLDPDRSPRTCADLRRKHHLAHRDFTRPLLIVTHLDRAIALKAAELAAVEEDGDRRRLAAIGTEGRLLAACKQLRGEMPRVTWLGTPEMRPLQSTDPLTRDRSVGVWLRQVAGEGYQVLNARNWAAAADSQADCLVLPGPSRRLPPEAIATLQAHLARGGSLLIALDVDHATELTALGTMLTSAGISWMDGQLMGADGTAVRSRPQQDTGPTAFAARAEADLVLPHAVPLLGISGERVHGEVGIWLPAPAGSVIDKNGQRARLGAPHPCLLTNVRSNGSRIAVLASCDALADGNIDQAGNRLLASGLMHWLTQPEEAVALPPRQLDASRFAISDGLRTALRWVVGFGVPLLALVLGFATWRWRRKTT